MNTNDDSKHEAELAVLDMALAEELAGASPPDLWSRLDRRSAARPAVHRWLVAALVLIGIGVVVAVAVSTPAPQPAGAVQPEPIRTSDPDGPASLPELQARFAAARGATAQASATWSAELGRFVPLLRLGGLELLFQGRAQPSLDVDQVASIHESLRGATEGAVVPDVVWTHSLFTKSGWTRESGDKAVLLVQLRPDTEPRFAFVSPRGPVALTIPTFPAEELRTLEEATRETIRSVGLVIGSDGFAAISPETWRLRLIEVPARTHGELARFSRLRQLDLTQSPAWHDTAVLRAVARSPVQELFLQPALLAADAWPTIGSITALTELFLMPPDWLAIAMGKQTPQPAPGLDDAAVFALRNLRQLTELGLAGGSFGDDALRALGALPALQRLWLSGCPRVGGDSFAAFGELKDLGLLDCDGLRDDVIANLARMPKLTNLGIRSPGRGIHVAALRDVKGLTDLYLHGRIPPDELRHLADCSKLQKVSLQLEPPLRDEDLVWLHGLQHLRSLGIASDQVTAQGRAALKKVLPNCRIDDELW